MSVSRPTLLAARVLQFRDISPLLLITDSVFQSAAPLLDHVVANATSAGTRVLTINWRRGSDVCTMTRPADHGLPQVKDIRDILKEIDTLLSSSSSSSPSSSSTSSQTPVEARGPRKDRTLLAIPDLNDFLAQNAAHLPTFLSSLIGLAPGRVSLCAIYHTDIPLLNYPSHLPSPETLLGFLATTIIRVSSLTHVRLRREAERRARTSPVDLDLEGRDIFVPKVGVNDDALFLDLEHRRKSGRGVMESSVFDSTGRLGQDSGGGGLGGVATLLATADVLGLDDPAPDPADKADGGDRIPEEGELGFKIALSEKQKADRDTVVLPHYVQQEDGLGGVLVKDPDSLRLATKERATGLGNIYYEPDSGDDFDAEDPDDDLML